MPIRQTISSDQIFINQIDKDLANDQEIYPFDQPKFGSYLSAVLAGGITYPGPGGKFIDTNTLFYTILRSDRVAGFVALRNWLDQSNFSLGRYSEKDRELLYIGIAPDFQNLGLGKEALKFALQQNAQRNRHGTTLVRFKPGCTTFKHMLDREGFEFHGEKQNGKVIAFKYSFPTTIEIEKFDKSS